MPFQPVGGPSAGPTPTPHGEPVAAWAAPLLNAIGEGVALADASGRILWANELFAGLDPAVLEKIAQVCREEAAIHARAAGPGPDHQPAGPSVPVGREVAAPGDAAHYQVLISPVQASAASTPGDRFAIAVRDVTPIRRTQHKIDAIDRAGGELVRLEADTVRKMNASERVRFLEGKIVRFAKDLLHFDHFAIRLLDERTGKLELVIKHELPESFDSFDIYPRLEGCGISGYVAATGRSYLCEDTARDELFLPGLTGARSSLTVPLRLNDKIIGIFDIESQQPGAFRDSDRQFAEIFARYIAMAMHILDLLVVERSTTNQSVSGRVEGELSEPLQDIINEVDHLRHMADHDPQTAAHIERIRSDVEAIRRRVRDVAAGPTTLLGVDRALADRTRDPALEGRRILVADDEPRIRRIIAEVLKHRGCEVVVCENGAQAIEVLRTVEAGRVQPFDLVLSDIKMPDRNGYEVFAAARASKRSVPVILMTGFGYDPHHSIVRASQEGLQSVLFKPFQVEMLLDQVRKAVTPAPKI
ncbi:MAG: response regulator [Phycisphaerales bacterium]|nr:response regulator [Phycisphaerales bacterium]